MTQDNISISYKQATQMLDEWLPTSDGRWFTSQDLYSQFNAYTVESKHNISQALLNYRQNGKLSGERGRYRYVNREVDILNWQEADPSDILDIRWPRSDLDGTHFQFDDNLTLYPGSIVVVAGVSNMGKTTFMLNIVKENFERWHVRYLTNEMGAEEFADRITRYELYGYNFYNEDGSPKFEVAVRYDNYEDVIYRDGLNIIDYLDPGEEPFKVGLQIDAIKQNIGRGVAFIALQKKMTTVRMRDGTIKDVISDYGTGGQYSEHRARIVLHIERDHLYIKKAKKCRLFNLNGRRYSYTIEDGGSQFANIHEKFETEQ